MYSESEGNMSLTFDTTLFIDLETTKDGSIADIGAIIGSSEYHGRLLEKIAEMISGSKFICGHNIVAHDLPVLRQQKNTFTSDIPMVVDTLLLSPLLFPKKPYHRLMKDYRLFDEKNGPNNPLYDAGLCRELLIDQIAAFENLDSEMKNLYWNLLNKQEGFAGFFRLLGYAGKKEDAWKLCVKTLEGSICTGSDHSDIFSAYPAASAYSLALLKYGCPESIIPPWVMRNHSQVINILTMLRSTLCSKSGCTYCNGRRDIHGALQRHFGYDEFRRFSPEEKVPAQQKAVQLAVENRSFIAVFPTGGGKSITFQLPALMAGEEHRGLTVVISPLQALMKDQVDNLLDKQITRAVAINGLLSPLERVEAIERVENGQVHILYLAPETLRSESMLRLLSKRMIARFVIDEAHCFSSWGHDFRVDYLFIGKFIRMLQERQQLTRGIPVSCFTATAKPAVIEDIKKYFNEKLGLDLEVISADSSRKNLNYQIYTCSNNGEKFDSLLDILQDSRSPVIVYCARTKTTEALAEKLNGVGVPSIAYHGQLTGEVKKQNMTRFMKGDVNVAVATNAFGMGVDKDDVGVIVHYDIPASLENYAQETGRAARNPDINAECYLLFNDDDIKKHFELYYISRVNHKEISQIWKSVKGLTKTGNTVRRSALELAMMAGWDTEMIGLETKVRTAISALEEHKFVEREFNKTIVHAVSLLVRDVAKSSAIIDATHLSENDKRLAKMMVQRIIKDKETRIDYLAEIIDAHRDDVIRLIEYLKEIQILNDSDMDLSAYVTITRGYKNSVEIYRRYHIIETALLDIFKDQPDQVSLREINTRIAAELKLANASEEIKKILNYWEIRGFIKKRRIDQASQLYKINYIGPVDKLYKHSKEIHSTAADCIVYLHEMAVNTNRNHSVTEVLVEFSVPLLKQYVAGLLVKENLKVPPEQYHHVLLYLNSIGSIRLDHGFIIMYNPMTLVRTEDNLKRQYTEKDYDLLKKFYDQKVEQIHIIRDYALGMRENIIKARQFTSDYFTMPHNAFMKKYFSGREDQVARPLHPDIFLKIYGTLSPEQLKIIKDTKNKRVMVAAGPGSGKTRVLVHKVASILATEDVKPEQFLMLTFSRSAVMEFRSRLIELIGDIARHVDIFTYHSFCFNLLSVQADEKLLDSVIDTTLKKIADEEIDLSRVRNKSVLVIDEFQDINENDYKLIKAIIDQSGELRILAVGDDDQNIFTFRGASNNYMRSFVKMDGAVSYELLTNFRSSSNIVQLSNRLRKAINSKIKQSDLVAHSNDDGVITFHHFHNSSFILPLVDAVMASATDETGILTLTNENALMIHALLAKNSIHSEVVNGEVDFKIKDLEEISWLTDNLHQSAVSGVEVARETWDKLTAELFAVFKSSKHIDLVKHIIERFGMVYKHIVLSEWIYYTLEYKVNDLIDELNSKITISTIHKAKGREYETVFLFLPDIPLNDDDDFRRLYVAMTRAKKNLHVFTNNKRIISLADETCTITDDINLYAEPDQFAINFNYTDVNLGFFTSQNIIKTNSAVHSGKQLNFKENNQMLYVDDTHCCCKLSTKGLKKLQTWLDRGFRVSDAEAEYSVRWFNPDDEKKYPVILPKLTLERE
jgi:ATP-dependent DNA helicase RecQ